MKLSSVIACNRTAIEDFDEYEGLDDIDTFDAEEDSSSCDGCGGIINIEHDDYEMCQNCDSIYCSSCVTALEDYGKLIYGDSIDGPEYQEVQKCPGCADHNRFYGGLRGLFLGLGEGPPVREDFDEYEGLDDIDTFDDTDTLISQCSGEGCMAMIDLEDDCKFEDQVCKRCNNVWCLDCIELYKDKFKYGICKKWGIKEIQWCPACTENNGPQYTNERIGQHLTPADLAQFDPHLQNEDFDEYEGLDDVDTFDRDSEVLECGGCGVGQLMQDVEYYCTNCLTTWCADCYKRYSQGDTWEPGCMHEFEFESGDVMNHCPRCEDHMTFLDEFDLHDV